MKLTKEDYMRLPKERLAELLAEMDNTPVEPIIIPSSPSVPNTTPNPYVPYGPIITYAGQNGELACTDGKTHDPSFIE